MHWLYNAIILLVIGVAGIYAVVMLIHGYFMLHNNVPYVRLPAGAMDQVAAELAVSEGDIVYDLGCGDGRVLSALRRQNRTAQYIGVENDWTVWLLGKLRARGVEVRHAEISETELGQAKRIFAYLGPEMMKALEPRFEQELRPGARVVSVQFPLPTRRPDKIVEFTDSANYAARLYVYNY